MVENLKRGQIYAPDSEVKSLIDPREKLRVYLPTLPRVNAKFLENIIGLKIDEKLLLSDKTILNFTQLLENDKVRAREKIQERLSARDVSIMDVMGDFNSRENVVIARHSPEIQQSDGCTGGCPWCGAQAERSINKMFSYNSEKEYLEKYGKYWPISKPQLLYGSTDPFDVISNDGTRDYTDYANLFVENTRGVKLFTSTSVPIGSELSVIKYIVHMYSQLEDTKDPRIKKASRFWKLRLSRFSENKKRITKIMQILKGMGIWKEFINSAIEIVDRDGDKRGGAKAAKYLNIGHFINHPDRDEYGRDMFGILDGEYLVISPNGVSAESGEIVTEKNPRGIKIIYQTPGLLKIPEFIAYGRYSEIADKKGNIFQLLPKHRYKIYNKGNFFGVETVESVGRDALAFAIALDNLQAISKICSKEEFRKHPEWALDMKRELNENFVAKYKERKESSRRLFKEESDKQAVEITRRTTEAIDKWLDNIDKELGVEV